MKIKISFLLIILMISFAATADEYSDLKKQIRQEASELNRLTNSKADIVKRLNIVSSSLANNKKLVRIADTAIRESSRKLQLITDDIKFIDKKIYKTRRSINRSNIFMIDNLGYADAMILADSKSAEDVIMMLEILSHATKKLIENIAALHLDITELNDLKKSEQENKLILEENLKTKKASLKESEALKKNQESTLKLIKNDLTAQEEYIDQLKFKQSELEKIIKQRTSVNVNKDYNDGSLFYRAKGKMSFPMKGKIIERYGNQMMKDVGVSFFNKGIKISADSSREIFAPYSGKVVFADQLKGFLNLVVVSHDASYYTVYGNLNSLKVKTGDNILQGDTIGAIDVVDIDDASYLYFELRKGEDALDPQKWFR